MAFNGSGLFNLAAGNPVVTGTTISSTWANNTLADIASGLSTTITKDGQTTPTANIPMGGFKITGLGAPTLNGDALRFENLATLATTGGIQAQTYTAFTTAGTSTAYTLTTSPAAPALVDNQRYQIQWSVTSGATPTLARDGLTAKNLKYYDLSGAKVSITAGLLVAGVKNDVVYDGTDYVVLGINALRSRHDVGDIFTTLKATAPAGSFALPGAPADISRTTYALLFAEIGTMFGAGDGSTTFGSPWIPANYTPVQASANIGTFTTGQVISHTHGEGTTNVAGAGASSLSGAGNLRNNTLQTDAAGGTANLAAGLRVLVCCQYL